MNNKELYKNVSKKLNIDEDTVRIVWNHLWLSIKNGTQEHLIIDIDNFGAFHIDMKRLLSYTKRQNNEKYNNLLERAKNNKKLNKLLPYGQDDEPVSDGTQEH